MSLRGVRPISGCEGSTLAEEESSCPPHGGSRNCRSVQSRDVPRCRNLEGMPRMGRLDSTTRNCTWYTRDITSIAARPGYFI
jgi:hypothetical protein